MGNDQLRTPGWVYVLSTFVALGTLAHIWAYGRLIGVW